MLLLVTGATGCTSTAPTGNAATPRDGATPLHLAVDPPETVPTVNVDNQPVHVLASDWIVKRVRYTTTPPSPVPWSRRQRPGDGQLTFQVRTPIAPLSMEARFFDHLGGDLVPLADGPVAACTTKREPAPCTVAQLPDGTLQVTVTVAEWQSVILAGTWYVPEAYRAGVADAVPVSSASWGVRF